MDELTKTQKPSPLAVTGLTRDGAPVSPHGSWHDGVPAGSDSREPWALPEHLKFSPCRSSNFERHNPPLLDILLGVSLADTVDHWLVRTYEDDDLEAVRSDWQAAPQGLFDALVAALDRQPKDVRQEFWTRVAEDVLGRLLAARPGDQLSLPLTARENG